MKGNSEFKKKEKKQKHLMKELQSFDLEECSASDKWESIDMKKQLHPIGYYINDREEMIRQVFSVIKGDRLKKLLPPILKNVDLDELKADCLIHLVGMSSKRIKSILEGRDMDISSDESDSESDSSLKDGLGTTSTAVNLDSSKKRKRIVSKSSAVSAGQELEDGCSIISGDDLLEIGLLNSELTDDFFESNENITSSKVKRKKFKPSHHEISLPSDVPSFDHSDIKADKTHEVRTCDLSSKDKDLHKKASKTTDQGGGETKGKTLLEILELEMRARAIRALLKRDNSPSSPSSSKNQTAECSHDVAADIIDLTSLNDTDGTKVKASILNDKSKDAKENEISSNDSLSVADKVSVVEDELVNKNSIKTTDGTEQAVAVKNKTESNKEINVNDNNSEMKINFVENDITNFPAERDCAVEGDDTIKSVNINHNTEPIVESSWAQRWLEKKSKDVQRLVSTSKMCTNIRNKMKRSKLNRGNTFNSLSTNNSNQKCPSEFKGSIDEYNTLKGTSEINLIQNDPTVLPLTDGGEITNTEEQIALQETFSKDDSLSGRKDSFSLDSNKDTEGCSSDKKETDCMLEMVDSNEKLNTTDT